jgi:methylenetetrahydrofolate reductase (NADPH)
MAHEHANSPDSTSGRHGTDKLRLSFEFFPPRSESGQGSLARVARRLGALRPDFYSCTYGAGGSTKSGTRDTITRLVQQGLSMAPHLSIGSDQQSETDELLDYYRNIGVKRIVALRGDLPSGTGLNRFGHNAETLVRRIRDHSADHFHLEVAAYPETHPDAATPAADLEFFKRKVEAGANTAITQYFYNAHAYFDFLERCEKARIQIPIFPGVMPITNFEGIIRFSDNCGADVPRWIRKQLEAYQDDEQSLKQFGIDVVTTLCDELLDAGAPGLHFYTLNRWGASLAICSNLGLHARAA